MKKCAIHQGRKPEGEVRKIGGQYNLLNKMSGSALPGNNVKIRSRAGGKIGRWATWKARGGGKRNPSFLPRAGDERVCHARWRTNLGGCITSRIKDWPNGRNNCLCRRLRTPKLQNGLRTGGKQTMSW